MDKRISEELTAFGGDLTQPEWEWFLKRGPHGEDFTWGQTKNEPPGYVGVEHLKEIIESKISQEPHFIIKIRKVIGIALKSNNAELVRRGIQVASIIGESDELALVGTLTKHPSQEVVNDAKACIFLLKRRLRQNS